MIKLNMTGRGLKIPAGRGSHFIACYAGLTNVGFIPESKWVLQSISTHSDKRSNCPYIE
jgi:hypothetical protein